jgi:hypothetical protein
MSDQTTDHLSGAETDYMQGDAEAFRKRVHPDHLTALVAAEEKGRSEERERLAEVVTAARLWLRAEHGETHPDLYETDAPAARLSTALASLDSDQEGS